MGQKRPESVRRSAERAREEHELAFDQFLSEARASFDDHMKEAFQEWCEIYAHRDLMVARQLYDVVCDLIQTHGSLFIYSFYICGTRWDELTFDQFRLVMRTLGTIPKKNSGSPEDEVERLKALQEGARIAADLMKLLLEHDLSSDLRKAEFLAQKLALFGKKEVQLFPFILKKHDFRDEYMDPAFDIIRIGHIQIADEFMKACERWELDKFRAARLKDNIVYLLQKPKGVEKCLTLLRGPGSDLFRQDGRIIH